MMYQYIPSIRSRVAPAPHATEPEKSADLMSHKQVKTLSSFHHFMKIIHDRYSRTTQKPSKEDSRELKSSALVASEVDSYFP